METSRIVIDLTTTTRLFLRMYTDIKEMLPKLSQSWIVKNFKICELNILISGDLQLT